MRGDLSGGPSPTSDVLASSTFLALPWRHLLDEEDPRVRLHRLFEAAEMGVRWAAVVAFAEALHASGGTLPERLAVQVRDHIERPTFGRWIAILRATLDVPPAARVLGARLHELGPELKAAFPASEREERSIVDVRNQVAHGGPLSRRAAGQAVIALLPRVERWVHAVVGATSAVEAIVAPGPTAETVLRLVGVEPVAGEWPESLPLDAVGTFLTGSGSCLPLAPLALFGPVRRLSPEGELRIGEDATPRGQLYLRAGDALQYTPLGGDAGLAETLDVASLRAMFRLDEPRTPRRGERDGLEQARRLAAEQVGREAELSLALDWLATRRDAAVGPRVGWVHGGPGLGKSTLMAAVATSVAAGGPRPFVHRFRLGDDGCGRRPFLRALHAHLGGTGAPGDAALKDEVQALLSRSAGFVAIVDGLDEIAQSDARVPDLILELAESKTTWLVSGRADHGLERLSEDPRCQEVFPGGLPPMRTDELRGLLLEGLHGAQRDRLVRLDQDAELDSVAAVNSYVERVADRARGLPLYVRLLLEDLRHGRMTVGETSCLPASLVDYYAAIVSRSALTGLARDLPLVVALLARASVPLGIDALAALLSPDMTAAPAWRRRAEAALRAGAAMIRRATTEDGAIVWSTYHTSFREFTAERRKGTDGYAEVVAEAEERLLVASTRALELMPGELREHALRFGTSYALCWSVEEARATAALRLTDFAYLVARLETPVSAAVDGVIEDLERAETVASTRARTAPFRAFFTRHAHALRRGTAAWPTTRILLQLAWEHGDDSPVTQAAETWLSKEPCPCTWTWMHRSRRPAFSAGANGVDLVLEGHAGDVLGFVELPHDDDGRRRLVSWDLARGLRTWDLARGSCIAVCETPYVLAGLVALDHRRVVSWSSEATDLSVYDALRGCTLGTLGPHEAQVLGAITEGPLWSYALAPDGAIVERRWREAGTSFEVETVVRFELADGRLLREHKLVAPAQRRLTRLAALARRALEARGGTHEDVGPSPELWEFEPCATAPGGRAVSVDQEGRISVWSAGGELQENVLLHGLAPARARRAPRAPSNWPIRDLAWLDDERFALALDAPLAVAQEWRTSPLRCSRVVQGVRRFDVVGVTTTSTLLTESSDRARLRRSAIEWTPAAVERPAEATFMTGRCLSVGQGSSEIAADVDPDHDASGHPLASITPGGPGARAAWLGFAVESGASHRVVTFHGLRVGEQSISGDVRIEHHDAEPEAVPRKLGAMPGELWLEVSRSRIELIARHGRAVASFGSRREGRWYLSPDGRRVAPAAHGPRLLVWTFVAVSLELWWICVALVARFWLSITVVVSVVYLWALVERHLVPGSISNTLSELFTVRVLTTGAAVLLVAHVVRAGLSIERWNHVAVRVDLAEHLEG